MNNHLLNINILEHPTNRNKTVFFYTEQQHSDYFKSLLQENGITYEFQFDDQEKKYYFGINKALDKQSKKLNYLVFAKFRKPFINNVFGKYLLLGITLLFIFLAIVGYIIS